MNAHELALLLTAKDGASATLKQIARVLTSELATALGEAAQAAAEDEANTMHLEQAVANAGQSYADLQPLLEERIKLGQQLAFTDSQTRDALSEFIVLTKDAGKALDLESLAMDVARAKHMDLDQAVRLIERTYNGSTDAGERYGFVIRDNSSATQALAQIQQQAAGQAETYAASSAGGIDRIKDSLAEWKEGIGSFLGPAGQWIALLPGMETGITAVAAAGSFALPALKALFLWMKVDAIPTLAALDIALAPILLAVGAVAGALGLGILAGNAVSDAIGLPPLDVQVPGFADGGVVPGALGAPMLAKVHGGEEIRTPAQRSSGNGDVHIHIQNAYGFDDFEQQVSSAVTRAKQRGAFRGVLA